MHAESNQRGFSLVEVMLAIGVLAVGMLFVSGTFTLGVHYTVVASEKAIAPIVAEEAFAKIRLYGLSSVNAAGGYAHTQFGLVDKAKEATEFYYPSHQEPLASPSLNQYSWCAITKPVAGGDIQVTVFVLRRQGSDVLMATPVEFRTLGSRSMVGAPVVIDRVPAEASSDYKTLARIIAIDDPGNRKDAKLDPPWDLDPTDIVWTVLPDQGRNPIIGVYQKYIRF